MPASCKLVFDEGGSLPLRSADICQRLFHRIPQPNTDEVSSTAGSGNREKTFQTEINTRAHHQHCNYRSLHTAQLDRCPECTLHCRRLTTMFLRPRRPSSCSAQQQAKGSISPKPREYVGVLWVRDGLQDEKQRPRRHRGASASLTTDPG